VANRWGCVGVAQGLSLGLTPSRMRGADLDRPFHGIRIPVSRETDAAVEEGVRSTSLALTRDGALARRCEALQLTLPLVDPATLFLQLAAQLCLHDLVAVGDALAHRPVFAEYDDERPWLTPDQLGERVEASRGRRKRSAARAVRLIRPGAESRPESLLRLTLVDAGLPEPEVNVDVSSSSGRFLGRGDLVYRAWQVIVEYDGEQHRTSTRQYDRDLARLDDFAQHGWRVIRVVGRSFFADRHGTAQRVAAALLPRGWRP
jgi:very-short-patch-repair endonuclease